MRWTLATAGLALFAVGTIALVRTGQAQNSPYLPLATPTRSGSSQADAHPAGKRQPSPEEMKIELAWMADPATFPCRLGAYRVVRSVIIRGPVPTEGVRARAIEIAAEQSGLPVVDELRINSNMPMRAGGVPVDAVLRDAAETLRQALGDKANPLELTAAADGQVVVTGSLNSPADRLTVSRCLWAVHGCTSVKNKVTVNGEAECQPLATNSNAPKVTQAKTTDPISKTPVDSKAAAKPGPAVPKAAPIPEKKLASTATDASVPALPKVAPIPEKKTASAQIAPDASVPTFPKAAPIPEKKTAPTLTATDAAVSKTAKEAKRDPIAVPPAVLPPVEGTHPARALDQPSAATKPVSTGAKTMVLPPPESRPHVAPLSESADPAAPDHKVLTLPQRTHPSVAPLSESGNPPTRDRKEATLPERKSAPPINDKDKPRPSGGVPILAESRTAKSKPLANGNGVANIEPRPTDKTSEKVEPVGHKPVPATPLARPAAPAEAPYVAPGVISYEDGPASPASAPRAASFTDHLRERIVGICGDAGKNVEIQTKGEKRLMIRVQCATREEGEGLSRRILQMRELAPYEVSLEIKVAP
jgi:hypothetical protein